MLAMSSSNQCDEKDQIEQTLVSDDVVSTPRAARSKCERTTSFSSFTSAIKQECHVMVNIKQNGRLPASAQLIAVRFFPHLLKHGNSNCRLARCAASSNDLRRSIEARVQLVLRR